MEKSKNYYNKSTVNTLTGISATGLSTFITALIIPIVVVKLGSINWAIYALFLLYVAILSFVEGALQSYCVQRIASMNVTKKSYVWIRDAKIISVIAIVTLVILSSIIYVESISVYNDTHLIFIFAILNLLPRIITSLIKGEMQGQKSQFDYYVFTTLINTGRPISILFCLLIFEISINHILIIFVCYSYFEFTLFLYLRHVKVNNFLNGMQAETNSERNLFLFLLGSGLLSVLASNIDKIMVFYTSSTLLAANYTFAASISGLLYIFINAAIISFAPQFRELNIKKEYNLIRRNLYLISFLNNLFIFASIIMFLIFIDYLLPHISTELDQENIKYNFLLLSLSCLISSNLWVPGVICISFDRASFSFSTNMIFVIIYVITYMNFPQKYDDNIFSTSMLIASLFTTFAGFTYFSKVIFEVNAVRFIFITLVLPSVIIGLIALPLWLIDSLYRSVYANAGYVMLIAAVVGKSGKKLASTVRLGCHRYRIFNELS